MKKHLLVLTGLALSSQLAGFAQDEPKPHGYFDQVIPRPTGQNGYEELVLAADLARPNAELNALQQLAPPLQTLAAIRKTLDQTDLVRARKLLRLGLEKPVRSPRQTIDDETIFPEFAGFRQLARMLAFQLYVDFADGQTSRAVETLRDCLRFGYVMQTDTLISGLVGVAVDAIAVKRFCEHLEQLSAADCDRLLAVVREWLRQPDPAIPVLEAERQGILRILQKYRSDPDKLLDIYNPDPDSEGYKEAQSTVAALKSNPGGAGAAFDQAGAAINARFDRMLAELRRPNWERQYGAETEDKTAAGRLSNMIDPMLGPQITDKYARDQTQVQLLGVYAAVRRFWWEHQMLPSSLAALNLGALALDPFTGKPFTYKAISDKDFEVGSIGPVDRSSDSATSGQRTAVTLPMKRQP